MYLYYTVLYRYSTCYIFMWIITGHITFLLYYMYRVLAKEWKRGAALLYAISFPFFVVKGMQLNHKYA